MRLARGLSQSQLADQANRLIRDGEGALDANTISRIERGAISHPSGRNLDALCTVLGATPADLGFGDATEHSDALKWSARTGKASPESFAALAEVLASNRLLEDATSAGVVLPVIRHHLTTVTELAREAHLPLRKTALDLLNEYQLYRGWLRFATGDKRGARRDFDTGMIAAVEGGSSTGIADSLSFKGYVDLHEGNPLSAASLTSAANHYEKVPINRQYFHLLTARSLAAVGDLADSDRELLAADKIVVNDADLNGRNYWYSPGWLTVQRGLVHATAGRTKLAIRAIEDGLAGMPPEQRNADWVRKYEDVRDTLLSA